MVLHVIGQFHSPYIDDTRCSLIGSFTGLLPFPSLLSLRDGPIKVIIRVSMVTVKLSNQGNKLIFCF